MEREWDQGHASEMDAALNRVDVHFEFCQKLGVEYYCFHDRDVSPEGATVAETEKNFDVVAAKLLAKQKETGIKLLWGTSNLFSHKRFMHGGPTNPDPGVVCMAAAQIKKCLDVTKKLGGENFVLWGGRDGYQTLLNTDYAKEQENYATFLKMTADYAAKIGWKGQLLLEPKPREPAAHQYNFDAETTLGFLDRYGLTDKYSLNLEANHGTLAGHSGEHEVEAAYSRGKLGSIDANRNEVRVRVRPRVKVRVRVRVLTLTRTLTRTRARTRTRTRTLALTRTLSRCVQPTAAVLASRPNEPPTWLGLGLGFWVRVSVRVRVRVRVKVSP